MLSATVCAVVCLVVRGWPVEDACVLRGIVCTIGVLFVFVALMHYTGRSRDKT